MLHCLIYIECVKCLGLLRPYSQSSLRAKTECECGLSEDLIFTVATQLEFKLSAVRWVGLAECGWGRIHSRHSDSNWVQFVKCGSLSAVEVVFTVVTQMGFPTQQSENLSAGYRTLKLRLHARIYRFYHSITLVFIPILFLGMFSVLAVNMLHEIYKSK